MKQSEIKHSLEKIHWAFLGVVDMIDRPKDILSEHLQMLSDETKAALKLVIALCDYMIDDGEIDLTEDLDIIHDEATKITNGVYGRVPEDAKTDERQPIIAEILINVANMWVEIQHYWDWVEDKEPATPTPQGETPPPPTPQEPETETPQMAVLQPYTPNPVGRPIEDDFADTIADKYTIQGKADTIQGELQKAISGMTEPMAIFALFVECFNREILKQCPNHKQALALIEDVAMRNAYKRQWHNKQRNIYFDKEEAYLYLNETDSEQDNAINKYILQAEPTVKKLLLLLEPPTTKKKARKGA